MTRTLSTGTIILLSIHLLISSCFGEVVEDRQRSLQAAEWTWKQPAWWVVYRSMYGKRLKKCIFRQGVIPIHGDTCSPIQNNWFMCMYGSQACQGLIVESITHPETRCDCQISNSTDGWKWACYDWKPCMDPTTASATTLTTALTPSPTRTPSKNLTIGVYYYPWYGTDFHKGSPFLREKLLPPQLPKLGRYDDTDPAVISQHLKWSRNANIKMWVTSWWGPKSIPNNTTLTKILPHNDLGSHKISLFYETPGRIPDSGSLVNVEPDMVYICENYFSHPNYYRIDDRPVLFVYVTRKLSGLGWLDDVLLLMRSTANKYGFNPYIIGDQVFQDAPPQGMYYAPFDQLDGVTNYDVRGGMNLPWGTNYVTQTGVDNYFAEQLKWKVAANNRGCAYVPPAVPGYNDRSIRLDVGRAALSRRLTPNDGPGSLFRATLKGAREIADSMTNYLVMVNSFNEWHEDTQIEPTSGGNKTIAPFELTQGVEYDAYGEMFLDILKTETIGW